MSQARRNSTLSKPSWSPDAELFSLEALSTPEGLEAAVVHLQVATYTSGNSTSVLNFATTYLLTLDPCVFPLLLSCKQNRTPSVPKLMLCIPIADATLNEEWSGFLSWTFPTTAKDFAHSNAQKILELLRTYYLRLPPEDEDHKTSKLRELHYKLHQSARALDILSESTFSSTLCGPSELRSPISPSEGNDKPFSVKKNRKKSRRASVIIDESAFRDIGASMPHGMEDAKSLEARMLEERKDILTVSVTDGPCHFMLNHIISNI